MEGWETGVKGDSPRHVLGMWGEWGMAGLRDRWAACVKDWVRECRVG